MKELIRELKEKYNITNNDIARYSGLSYATIASYASGRRKGNSDVIKLIVGEHIKKTVREGVENERKMDNRRIEES